MLVWWLYSVCGFVGVGFGSLYRVLIATLFSLGLNTDFSKAETLSFSEIFASLARCLAHYSHPTPPHSDLF